jgi:quercetin dioxygenase-like cupin family protein
MSDKTQAQIVDTDQVTELQVDKTIGATMKVLIGPDQGAPNFITRLFTLQPGGKIPPHLHDNIEHEQYILEGEMVVAFDEEPQRTVSAGQAVFIPAGVAHRYENLGETPVRFICIVPKTTDYTTTWL